MQNFIIRLKIFRTIRKRIVLLKQVCRLRAIHNSVRIFLSRYTW